MGSITFYIIPINNLFLLYLANMDNLEAFFNNNTNQVIQTQSFQSHIVI